ncbi:probable insulin-like peptide 2 [Drosophila ficusphila]|uniref:probable insulin-like peptide 2 n=1 Tax=Drosophila ficusphila TaxID=30025 RepID=UPI0007E6C866|nr:probable insulin-like peptide 2 [Drosophila ficusphila]
MCKSLTIVSMLVVIFLAHSAVAQYSLCSERLNDMLSIVCKQFNPVIPHKRGMLDNDGDSLNPLQFVQETESDDNSVSDMTPYGNYFRESVMSSMAAIRRRTRQGIVERCCKQPCKIDVVREYCSVAY